MKQHKLLNKTLHYYIGFGILMALLIEPGFYLLIKKYHLHEVDEYLYLQLERTADKSIKSLKISDISTWNRFNSESMILHDTVHTEHIIYKTESVFNEVEQEYEPYRVLYAPVEIESEKYLLAIQMSIDDFQKTLQSSVLLQMLLLACLMAGLGVIARFIHERLWKPFYRTLSLIQHFNIRKNEAPRFPVTDIKEFNQLNLALEKLIDNNLQAYKIQKEFTENASHEMQTPLAVLRSQLDMLLQQPSLTKEQSTIIQTLHETISRLVRMNNNLLLLAKIDNGQIPDNPQTLYVYETIKKSLLLLSRLAETSNIAIEMQSDDAEMFVYANQQLFECMVNNLLTNAIKHNISGGRIQVTLATDTLTITNTGIDKPLENSLLFRRFGRMNPAAKGSGLGLAIARQIGSLYGWQINYDFEGGMHKFEVNFHSEMKK